MGCIPGAPSPCPLAITRCCDLGETQFPLHCLKIAKFMSQEGVSFSFIREREC